jgi:hypothetical protein
VARKRVAPTQMPSIPTGPMALSGAAQALFDEVDGQWSLTPPVRTLLRLACEQMTRAEACDAITAVEGLTIGDMKGSQKAHPLALLSRDLKNSAQNTIQKLLTNLG